MGNTMKISSIEATNPKEESQEQEEGDSNFTCEICIEPMSSNMKFNNSHKCAHHFCMDCMAKYIHVKVDHHVAANVQCPGLKCKEFLDPLFCRTLIEHQVFNKWCDNLCHSAILKIDRCYCPYQDCSSLVLNECGGTLKRSECPNCKRLFCYQCMTPWHAGFKCKESGQVRDTNDILFGQLAEKEKWIRCPRCHYFVECTLKNCKRVICRCHMYFCYICGKMYYDGHSCDKNETLIFVFIFYIASIILGLFLIKLGADAFIK